MKFFIKQIFIPRSYMLTEVRSYTEWIINIIISIIFLNKTQSLCKIKQLNKNVTKKIWTNSEIILGIFTCSCMWIFLVSSFMPETLHLQQGSGASYRFCNTSLTRSQRVVWCSMWWQDRMWIWQHEVQNCSMLCIRKWWNFYHLSININKVGK